MLKTALHDCHVALGGRLVEFAGWSLPVQYPTGPIREHMAVRSVGGLFDVSHMARFEVSGGDTQEFLQKVLTRSIARRKPGAAVYSLMTYDDGTVVDDLIAFCQGDRWMLICNAINRTKDFTWLCRQADGFEVDIIDRTEDTAMLAVQGNDAARLVTDVLQVDVGILRPFTGLTATVDSHQVQVTRTGYTGEDGFELVMRREFGSSLFEQLLDFGQPRGWLACGLAARDSLRLEACLALYGHEISHKINAIEAGLAWAVSFRNPKFIGRNALLKAHLEGPERTLCAFKMEDSGVPRSGYPVFTGQTRVGTVTSGNKSPTLNQFIGMAMVDLPVTSNDSVDIDIRGRRLKARIVPKPFYKRVS